jgi:hypothetical protein
MLEENYRLYKSHKISEKEYLTRIKPIDEAIGKLEMATLQGNSVWIEAFLHCFQKQKH